MEHDNQIEKIIHEELIAEKIYLIRGQKVMIDRDLAELYGVETRVLNQAVRRNLTRFPEDFMFQLTTKEMKNWMSQFVISNRETLITENQINRFSKTKGYENKWDHRLYQ